MNKMRNIVWCLVFLVTGLWGCYDDKGNYDYKELPGLEIDTTGLNISGEKIAYQFQTLLVDPKINYAGNKEDLSYSWRLYPTNPVLDADKCLLSLTSHLTHGLIYLKLALLVSSF